MTTTTPRTALLDRLNRGFGGHHPIHVLRRFATIRRVARAHGISPARILSRERTRDVCAARHEVYYRLRALGMTYEGIGQMMRRDHGTVMYGCRKHARTIECVARGPVLRREAVGG